MVEHCLAKAVVAGSSPVSRSITKKAVDRLLFFILEMKFWSGLERVGSRNLKSLSIKYSCDQTVDTHRLLPRRDSKAKPCGASPVKRNSNFVRPLAGRNPFVLTDISPNRGIPRFPLHSKHLLYCKCFFVSQETEL